MSIFFRLCPYDRHTCSERACLADQHKDCRLENLTPFERGQGLPSSPPKADDYADNYYDVCWRFATRRLVI